MLTFIETCLFCRIVGDYLSDEEPGRTKLPLSRQRPSGEFARKSTTTVKRYIGKEILEGLRELKQGRAGRITTLPPIAGTREALALSQAEFARMLGVFVRTLQEWEQGRRAPSGAARTLILIANRNPKALLDVA